MTRYVFADLDQVSTELTRRASKVTAWLDAVASGGGPPGSTATGHRAAGRPPVSVMPADPVARLVDPVPGRSSLVLVARTVKTGLKRLGLHNSRRRIPNPGPDWQQRHLNNAGITSP